MNNKIQLVALLLIASISLSAQLNIKVGFDYNRTSNDIIANIVSEYNKNRPFLEAELEEVKGNAGVILGLRYRIGNTAIEGFASRGTGESEALGTDGQSSFRERYSLVKLFYGIGIEQQYGIIGMGSSIGYQAIKYETRISNSNRNRVVVDQKELAGTVYLNFEFASDKIAFSIRPYYQYSLGDYNISSLKTELAPDSNISAEDLLISPKSWGITIILYNGPQN